MKIIVSALWCCFAIFGCIGSLLAGAFGSTESLEQARLFGQDSRFGSVGVVGLDFGSGFLAAGSGVVIGDGSWVLLSGHQLNRPGINSAAFAIRDSAGVNVEVSIAQSWVIYPGFTGTGTGEGVDLALMRLSAPITSVSPANLFRGSVSELHGQTLSMAGYGLPGIAGQGVSDSRLLYAGENVVNDVPRPVLLDSGYIYTQFTAPNAGGLPLEWNGTPGDSGGAWGVLQGNVWEVAAISSGGITYPAYDFGSITYAMPVSGALPWIDSLVAVPEPEHYAAIAGLPCIGWALLRRRQR